MLNFKTKAYKIYDHSFSNWMSEVHDRWVYDDFMNDPVYKKKWISITSVAWDKSSDAVFLGVGSFSNELLWRFDRSTKQFENLNYEKFGNKYDAKFHRSLELDDGILYAAPALFHDVNKQFEAQGGRIIKYNISNRTFEFLSTPVKRVYVQSIAIDKKTKVLYGFGASPEVFWKYDIDKNESKFIAYIGSGAEFAQAHNPVIDDEGKVWGTYGILRAFAYDTGIDSIRLFCYNPSADSIEFLSHGLPRVNAKDKGIIDTAINGGDGFLYLGTTEGGLVRLNPDNGNVKLLCKPADSRRLAGLVMDKNKGVLIGITGEEYDTKLFIFDTITEKLLDIVPIVDANGDSPVRIHHIAMTDDGTIYAGENDNRDRPGYLWELYDIKY